jgi:hypothetical protein
MAEASIIDEATGQGSRRIRPGGAALRGVDCRRARRLTPNFIIPTVTTMLIALRSALVFVVVGFSSAAIAADIQDHTALAAALEHVEGTLENSLQAGEEIGKPISAKFALDDGSLQLSLWVAREDGFAEFILYPALRFVTEIYDFRDPDKVATAQKLAMDSATVSLLSATENAIKANHGFRAVSAYPVLAEGDPIAVVTLLDANAVKIVTEKLY